MTLEQFAEAVVVFRREDLREVARRVYPDAKSFGSMSDAQRLALYDVAVGELTPLTDGPAALAPDAGTGSTSLPLSAPMPVEVSDATPYVDEADGLCGVPSPWTAGIICGLAAGHPSAHRQGNESW